MTAFRCEIGPAHVRDLLQRGAAPLVGWPCLICVPINRVISRPTVQLLLDAGAFESAALQLRVHAPHMLGRNGNGIVCLCAASISETDLVLQRLLRSDCAMRCRGDGLQKRFTLEEQEERRSPRQASG